jgi:uncharacterized protein
MIKVLPSGAPNRQEYKRVSPRTSIPMRFLMRMVPESLESAEFLKVVKSIANDLGVVVRNPKWCSYGALEVDLFSRSKGDVELLSSALEPLGTVEFLKDLGEVSPHRSFRQTVEDARDLFNSERYWESHEVLEGLWRVLTGDEKKYIQGVILVCAAFVHHQKGEEGVALGVLRRAEKQISLKNVEHLGIDSKALQEEVGRILKTSVFKPFHI